MYTATNVLNISFKCWFPMSRGRLPSIKPLLVALLFLVIGTFALDYFWPSIDFWFLVLTAIVLAGVGLFVGLIIFK